MGRCSLPWTTAVLLLGEAIAPCCLLPAWSTLHEYADVPALRDVYWNGEMLRRLRRSLTAHPDKVPFCGDCRDMRRFAGNVFFTEQYPDLKRLPAPDGARLRNLALNRSEFETGAERLISLPSEMVYVLGEPCNIRCKHCFQTGYGETVDVGRLRILYESLGTMAVRHLVSGGEPLAMSVTKDLFGMIPAEHKRESELLLQTNAMLLRERFDMLRGFGKLTVRISIASFDPATYEAVHVGASHARLIENLKFVSALRAGGENISLELVTVVMKSNLFQLSRVLEEAKAFGFDRVWFTEVASANTEILVSEDIFSLPHMLEEMPGWEDALHAAQETAMRFGYGTAAAHAAHLRGLLPSTAGQRLLKSKRTLEERKRAIKGGAG
jgi:pyruvate-formate lyase-activating enzyme